MGARFLPAPPQGPEQLMSPSPRGETLWIVGLRLSSAAGPSWGPGLWGLQVYLVK